MTPQPKAPVPTMQRDVVNLESVMTSPGRRRSWAAQIFLTALLLSLLPSTDGGLFKRLPKVSMGSKTDRKEKV